MWKFLKSAEKMKMKSHEIWGVWGNLREAKIIKIYRVDLDNSESKWVKWTTFWKKLWVKENERIWKFLHTHYSSHKKFFSLINMRILFSQKNSFWVGKTYLNKIKIWAVWVYTFRAKTLCFTIQPRFLFNYIHNMKSLGSCCWFKKVFRYRNWASSSSFLIVGNSGVGVEWKFPRKVFC